MDSPDKVFLCCDVINISLSWNHLSDHKHCPITFHDMVKLLPNYTHETPYSSHVRIRYGISFVSWKSGPCMHVCNVLSLWALLLGEPTLIARFMGPTWGPSGADRTHVGPIWAPWTLLSGLLLGEQYQWISARKTLAMELCLFFCTNPSILYHKLLTHWLLADMAVILKIWFWNS